MERIHVSVRARPLSPDDAKTSPWQISANSIFIPNQSSKFEFDRIFSEECKTQDVYRARTMDIVAAAVRGFNGTVFAYGQTNSGKTHTMRGSTAEPGVIPLAVHELFDIIQEEMDREFLLRMSYMEIYNEEINDLLVPEHRKLQIHESIERGIFVAGLREEIVASPEQVLELMEFGESRRHIGETNMNVYSSRSHTIFRMIIESREKTEDEGIDNSCDAVRVSVLNLVDLAGSERAAKTGAEGVRLKEGSHINKSLMTLGTVIKKLSEGAESHGSHVPYRDSKLTRILQPALGGNSNTAIICNITLAQVHADETKSSLQFASRALRVTNCAHVNEILTDAALLKRQKKEIEELRAKLQGSHSEHFEEEILNLRNTLLQTELEKERMALELEEEKKAQAERERRLQEQAKKIENLSSMVLCSNRDDSRDHCKKEKRRDTWCPGNISKDTLRELHSTVHEKASAVKPMKAALNIAPLLPFDELVNEASMDDTWKGDSNGKSSEDYSLPNANALLHVTSRRKVPLRKKSLPVENPELAEMQAEYENLLLKFEIQRTMSEVTIDNLSRNLAEADSFVNKKSKDNIPCHVERNIVHEQKNKSTREEEAILVIKQLQEKISMLEMEKSASQQNLDCVVELAREQNMCASEKYEELHKRLLDACEEAKVAREQLIYAESSRENEEENVEFSIQLLREVEEIALDVQHFRYFVESLSLVVEELFQSNSAMVKNFSDLKSLVFQSSVQAKSVIGNNNNLHHCMRDKINELEKEKLLLCNQNADLQCKIQELILNVQNSEKELIELSEQREQEKSELLCQIHAMQKELSCLSSSSLTREKENMRKDLEKTKAKLRETECKLKNCMQEKTKLEGENARAEREIKHLHGQKVILERDISKRESMPGRRRDSIVERSSTVLDQRQTKAFTTAIEQTTQDEYKKLEVLAFEMETYIASLEEKLTAAYCEKEEVISRTESMASDLETLSNRLITSSSELSNMQEEILDLRSRLQESESNNQKMTDSINTLVEEKEELAMQLTDALLALEEEKVIWSSKEKAAIDVIEDKSKSYNAEIALLSSRMSEVCKELESCREESKVLSEKLAISETAKFEKKFSMEKSLNNDQLKKKIELLNDQSTNSQEILKSKLEMLSLENHHAREEMNKLRIELDVQIKEKKDLLTLIRELDAKSTLTLEFQDQVNKEKAKLRMRLRGSQAKLDAYRFRYQEAVDELDFMNGKYEVAARKLKEQLASYGIEILNLKKQLAATKGPCHDP